MFKATINTTEDGALLNLAINAADITTLINGTVVTYGVDGKVAATTASTDKIVGITKNANTTTNTVEVNLITPETKVHVPFVSVMGYTGPAISIFNTQIDSKIFTPVLFEWSTLSLAGPFPEVGSIIWRDETGFIVKFYSTAVQYQG